MRLDRRYLVHFAHDHSRAQPTRAGGDPAATPAVADDHEHRAGYVEVGAAHQRPHYALPGAVAVVEQVLHLGVVHREHRKRQPAGRLARAVAHHPGGGLLTRADHPRGGAARVLVEMVHQVPTVVDHDVRRYGERVDLVLFEPAWIRSVAREHRNATRVQRRHDVVLGGKRVAPGDRDLRAARLEHEREVRGLGLQMDADRDGHIGKGALDAKLALEAAQNRHVAAYPLNLALADVGEPVVRGGAHIAWSVPTTNRANRSRICRPASITSAWFSG